MDERPTQQLSETTTLPLKMAISLVLTVAAGAYWIASTYESIRSRQEIQGVWIEKNQMSIEKLSDRVQKLESVRVRPSP